MTTFKALEPFSVAEAKLMSDAGTPDRITVGDGVVPDIATPDCEVRASLIRALLLDPDSPLHDKGLRLRGAWITGVLDLQGSQCSQDITLSNCRIVEPMLMINAQMRGLHLSSCHARGVSADNAQFVGSLYLRGGTMVEGEISLASARISGDLQICDAQLLSPTQDALFAPSLRVEGSVFLGNYPYAEGVTTLTASGTLFLSSARIDHDCFVTNTSVSLSSGEVSLGFFSATEEHGSNVALSLARAQVGGILYFQDNQIGSGGIVNLAGATVARLKDEPEAPGASYPIRLDGFRYGDFSRHTETSVAARLKWLDRRPADTPFTAQPYEHLASVLIALGHRNDARRVLLEKEKLLRATSRASQPHPLRRGMSSIVDFLFRFTVGYGYKPGRSVVIAIMLIAALGFFFDRTWRAGDMTPNAAPILISADWISATETHPENPGAFWSQPDQAGKDWETFNAVAYAADLVIPLVAFGQETAWAPSTSRSDWGRAGWWIRWFAKGIGWIITALGAAAITGVIRKD